MRGKRMWQTLRLYMILNAAKRTKYYKDKKIFYFMGENCLVMDRKVPLYAKLISIGNNVQIASNVHFNTHDITHRMLNNMEVRSGGGERSTRRKLGVLRLVTMFLLVLELVSIIMSRLDQMLLSVHVV